MNIETYKLQQNGFFSLTAPIVVIPKRTVGFYIRIGPCFVNARYDPSEKMRLLSPRDDSNIQLSFRTGRKCCYFCVQIMPHCLHVKDNLQQLLISNNLTAIVVRDPLQRKPTRPYSLYTMFRSAIQNSAYWLIPYPLIYLQVRCL